jgi:hypothetical protein
LIVQFVLLNNCRVILRGDGHVLFSRNLSSVQCSNPGMSSFGKKPEIWSRKVTGIRTADKETELHDSSPLSAEDRRHVESSEQAFFNQNGFVTDSMPEVDASKELLRTQKEAKRNREDRIKSGSLSGGAPRSFWVWSWTLPLPEAQGGVSVRGACLTFAATNPG